MYAVVVLKHIYLLHKKFLELFFVTSYDKGKKGHQRSTLQLHLALLQSASSLLHANNGISFLKSLFTLTPAPVMF